MKLDIQAFRYYILIAMTLIVQQSHGQYAYFDSTYALGSADISTNVLINPDGSYFTFGLSSYSTYLSRTVGNNGQDLTSTEFQIPELSSVFPGLSNTVIRSQDQNRLIFAHFGGSASTSYPNCIKFNADFTQILWHMEFQCDSASDCEFHIPIELTNGDILCVGAVHRDVDEDPWNEYSDLLLVKLNADGEIIWDNALPVYDDKFLAFSQAFELDNGDFLLFGAAYHNWNPLICRVSADGQSVLWKYLWGNEDLNDWLPWAVEEDDGTYTVAYKWATSEMSGGQTYGYPNLMRFDFETQEELWAQSFDGLNMRASYIYDMVKTPDNGYAVLGEAIEDNGGVGHHFSWILKTDSLGNEEWFKKYYHVWPQWGDAFITDKLYDLEVTSDGGFIAVGEHNDSNDPNQLQDTWLLKLDACGDVEWQGCEAVIGVDEMPTLAQPSLWPNPVSGTEATLTLPPGWEPKRLSVYNAQGGLVYQNSTLLNPNQINLPRDLSNGVYFVVLEHADGSRWSEKLVVQK